MGKGCNLGGKREGAGRKPLPPDKRKHTLSTRQPPDVLEWLTAQSEQTGQSRAEIVEDALRRRMRARR